MSDDRFESLESSGGVNIRLILGGVAAAALLLFILQNTDDAEVSFLWWNGSIPLSVLLLITVALTVVLTAATLWFLRRRHDG